MAGISYALLFGRWRKLFLQYQGVQLVNLQTPAHPDLDLSHYNSSTSEMLRTVACQSL